MIARLLTAAPVAGLALGAAQLHARPARANPIVFPGQFDSIDTPVQRRVAVTMTSAISPVSAFAVSMSCAMTGSAHIPARTTVAAAVVNNFSPPEIDRVVTTQSPPASAPGNPPAIAWPPDCAWLPGDPAAHDLPHWQSVASCGTKSIARSTNKANLCQLLFSRASSLALAPLRRAAAYTRDD